MQKQTSMKNVHYFPQSLDGSVYLGKQLAELLEKFQKTKILLLVSGGSCLQVLPEIDSKSFEGVTLAVLDERFDKTNLHSNFAQIEQLAWNKNFVSQGGELIDTKTLAGESQQDLAERFQLALKQWIFQNPQGKIVALFGMGGDGHTAGIFADSENPKKFEKLFDSKQLVVAYDAGDKNQFSKRVTTTNKFFQKIDLAFLFVFGIEKQRAFDDFKQAKQQAWQLPVMFLHKLKHLEIITNLK